MGWLGKLMGTEKEYPELDAASAGAERIARNRAALETFAHKTHDKLEIVPGERAVYVFIGRPPDAFGVVWFERDGEERNFKTLMKDRGLTPAQMQAIAEHLRAAYQAHRDEPRYGTTIAGKKVIVIPSATFERDVASVIHEVA